METQADLIQDRRSFGGTMNITIDLYPNRYIYIKIGKWDWIWERDCSPEKYH